MRRRNGLTLVEVCVAAVILALLLSVMFAALSMAKSHFLAGELSHAIQGAVVVGALIEDDLRAAVRDPATDVAIDAAPSRNGDPAFGLYRWISRPGGAAVIPVRWRLRSGDRPDLATLERTAWDPDAGKPVTERHAWISIPTLTGTGSDTRSGLTVIADVANSELTSVLLTVLARPRAVDAPGARTDRITIPLAVGVPRIPGAASSLFRPLQALEAMPLD